MRECNHKEYPLIRIVERDRYRCVDCGCIITELAARELGLVRQRDDAMTALAKGMSKALADAARKLHKEAPRAEA